MLGFLLFLAILFFICIPYLMGSIPFGLILAKTKKKDLIQLGSKSIGATNVTRNTNASLGILTLFLDFLKGYFAVVFSVCIFHLLYVYNPIFFAHLFTIAYISSFFVVIGHCFSIFIKFKGGKGISTAGGVILSVSPILFLIATIILILVFSIYKIVSLASLITAGSIGFVAYIPWLNYYYLQLINFSNIESLSTSTYFNVLATSIILTCMIILVISKHKNNIDRLVIKKERLFQVGKDDKTQDDLKRIKNESKCKKEK